MKVLLIVDAINDFGHPDGALYIPQSHMIVSRIQELRPRHDVTAFCSDWHTEDDPEFEHYPRHAVIETWGAQNLMEIPITSTDVWFPKRMHDSLTNTGLRMLLTQASEITVCGWVFDICVGLTGLSASKLAPVTIPWDATCVYNMGDTYRMLDALQMAGVTVPGYES